MVVGLMFVVVIWALKYARGLRQKPPRGSHSLFHQPRAMPCHRIWDCLPRRLRRWLQGTDHERKLTPARTTQSHRREWSLACVDARHLDLVKGHSQTHREILARVVLELDQLILGHWSLIQYGRCQLLRGRWRNQMSSQVPELRVLLVVPMFVDETGLMFASVSPRPLSAPTEPRPR